MVDFSPHRLIASLAAGRRPSPEELAALVKLGSPSELALLFAAADRVRRRMVGEAVHLRALIEFSNYCQADCLYCGLRRENTRLERYRLSLEEIEGLITQAQRLGFGTVVLQSGEDPWYDADRIARLIRRAKGLGLAVTLSLGEREPEEVDYWREQGADRYLLRHETANPELHRRLRPGRTLAGRVGLLRLLKELGYQIGAGFMVGLPGQTAADLAADLELAVELEADMVGIGPFIPHPETPLGGEAGGGVEETLKMVALARLLLPEALIPATTALGSLAPDGRERALAAGANVIMPSLTPAAARRRYALYPGRICLDESGPQCRACLEERLRRLGRPVAAGPGHSPRWERRNLLAEPRYFFYR